MVRRAQAGKLLLALLGSLVPSGAFGADAVMTQGDAVQLEDIGRSGARIDVSPNAESVAIGEKYYKLLIPCIVLKQDGAKYALAVFPRNEKHAGLLVTRPDGKPLVREAAKGLSVQVLPANAKPEDRGHTVTDGYHFLGAFCDTRYWYCDASIIFRPVSVLVLREGQTEILRGQVDFAKCEFSDSAIQLPSLLDDIDKHGFVRARNGDYVADDGTRFFFWAGHENHIPTKEGANAYAETYPTMGLNCMRWMGVGEMVKDWKTMEIIPEKLDNLLYLVGALADKGIYFHITDYHGYGPQPPPASADPLEAAIQMRDRTFIGATEKLWRILLTTPNPYRGGRPLKDDPALISFDLQNEWGLNARWFNYNPMSQPDVAAAWRREYCQFLLKKYGTTQALQKAWRFEPLMPGTEDPAKNDILIPTRFNGEREFPVGAGQHNQVIQGRFYLDGTQRIASPRIGDAIEMTVRVQYDWLKELSEFLKNEIGLKCAVNWTGDCFHMMQVANRHASGLCKTVDGQGGTGYYDWDNGEQCTSRTKNLKHFTCYDQVYGKPAFAHEASAWFTNTPYAWEIPLQYAIIARIHGYDGYAHHKMGACTYPYSDPYSTAYRSWYIVPAFDRRRGAFGVAAWILGRSKIEERRDKIIVAYPTDSVCYGGPERKMGYALFENWISYQLPNEEYHFRDVYDGPTDRIVIHEGRGPYGDYRAARHAILWCHGKTDRTGQDPDAKTKWFKLHGIEFKPGQKYYLDDKYFATTEDPNTYVQTHWKAESARWKHQSEIDAAVSEGRKAGLPFGVAAKVVPEEDYWAPEKGQEIPELDRMVYKALQRWGYPLPFSEDEIDKVYRTIDRTIEMDTRTCSMKADRDDMQVWFGRFAGKKRVTLSRLDIQSNEKQVAVALLPWDTADFKTSRSLFVWCIQNAQLTIKLPGIQQLYAVNWLGKRLYRVEPVRRDRSSLTFAAKRDDDIFFYELTR